MTAFHADWAMLQGDFFCHLCTHGNPVPSDTTVHSMVDAGSPGSCCLTQYPIVIVFIIITPFFMVSVFITVLITNAGINTVSNTDLV